MGSSQKKDDAQMGLTVSKEKDFSEWYTQVVQKAELADYSPVKGCMVIRPHAYAVWEKVQEYFNGRLKKLHVDNAYFPLFIPESFFKKEMQHAEGFTPEVAWIANKEEGGERLAVRPTSETIMYDSYAKWIRSHRDLPLRINQWGNVVRWETKQTRLFLRTREFLWQEGHCVYETEKECEKETLMILEEYQRLCNEVLAIEVIMGRKSANERFAGAKETYCIDAIMPDGRSLQMGTSHHLGQGFAKAFGISFLGKDGQEHTPWQNSWGVSTRLLGAMVMLHGDDKGIIIPPHAAQHPVVIVPIYREEEKDKVMKAAYDLEKTLGTFHPLLDDRDGYTPGWKFNQWELKGIPLRIELGPKDLAKKQAVLVRRDTGKKVEVPLTEVKKAVTDLLEEIHASLLKHSRHISESRIVTVSTWKELSHAIENKKVGRGSWCGKALCEGKVKDQLNGAKSINIPLDQTGKLGKCMICGEQAQYFALFGKVY